MAEYAHIYPQQWHSRLSKWGESITSIRYRKKNLRKAWWLYHSDHGRKAPDGKDHGGSIWFVSVKLDRPNAQNPNGYFKQWSLPWWEWFTTIADSWKITIQLLRLGIGWRTRWSVSFIHWGQSESGNSETWWSFELGFRWNQQVKRCYQLCQMDEFGQDGTWDNYLKIGETGASLSWV